MSRSWSARLDVTKTQAGHIGQISSGTIKQLQQGDQSTYQEACVHRLNQHVTRTHKSLVAKLVIVSECKLCGQVAVVGQLARQFDMQSIHTLFENATNVRCLVLEGTTL